MTNFFTSQQPWMVEHMVLGELVLPSILYHT